MKGIKGFQKGHPQYNTAHRSYRGSLSPSWKEDDVTYMGAHARVHRERGKANYCVMTDCKKKGKRFEWANLTGKYADVWDYIAMCSSCHSFFDRGWKKDIGKKLTYEEVLKIRKIGRSKPLLYIGTKFGISKTNVSYILTGKIRS